jgi:hypothetical protein
MGLAKAPSWLRSRERDHGRYVFWPTIGRRPALRFLTGRHTAWPELPEAIRAGIIAMVKTASGKGGGV